MANKGFFCMDGYLKRTAKLSDQELGRLFRACMVYHATGEVQELTGRESVAFDFIREDIDAANDAYEAKCGKNRANISKRWSGTNVYDGIRSNTTEETPIPKDTNVSKEKEKGKENIKVNNNVSPVTDGLFDHFWYEYPKKVAKPDAVRAWGKLKPDEALSAEIYRGLTRWKNSDEWSRDGGRYIPHPATWLNGRRWEDEIPQRVMRSAAAQSYEQRDYTGVQDEIMARQDAEMQEYIAMENAE